MFVCIQIYVCRSPSPYLGDLTLTMFALSWSLPKSLKSLCMSLHPRHDAAGREMKGRGWRLLHRLMPTSLLGSSEAKPCVRGGLGSLWSPSLGGNGAVAVSRSVGQSIHPQVFSSLRNRDSCYLGHMNWARVVGAFQLAVLHSRCGWWDACCVFRGGELILGNFCACFAGHFRGRCYK